MYKRWVGSEHPKPLGISTLQPLANLGKSGKAVPLLAALLHMVPTWLGVGLELWVVGQKDLVGHFSLPNYWGPTNSGLQAIQPRVWGAGLRWERKVCQETSVLRILLVCYGCCILSDAERDSVEGEGAPAMRQSTWQSCGLKKSQIQGGKKEDCIGVQRPQGAQSSRDKMM